MFQPHPVVVEKDIAMHQIKHSSGAVVAAETQASVAAIDTAVLTQVRLCASVIEAASESKMPVATTQKVLESMAAGMTCLVASRLDIVNAVRELALIQRSSSLNTTSFGCPDVVDPTQGSLPTEATPASLNIMA